MKGCLEVFLIKNRDRRKGKKCKKASGKIKSGFDICEWSGGDFELDKKLGKNKKGRPIEKIEKVLVEKARRKWYLEKIRLDFG